MGPQLAEDLNAIAKLATKRVAKLRVVPVELIPEPPGEKFRAQAVVSIAKANVERQTITGIVLTPETTDGQGDIMSADIIADAAHRYLANYNKSTKLGLQHKDFKPRFALVESYLAPIDFVIGDKSVKEGSWIMTVKVLEAKVWQSIKDGKLTGFSIGGVARVQQLKK